MLDCCGFEVFRVSWQLLYCCHHGHVLIVISKEGAMNETWGWWCCDWDWPPMFSPPDQKDSPTEMSIEHFLHSRTPQDKIFRKIFIRMKYFLNAQIRFSFNIWKEELNIMAKQTLPEGPGWSKLASLELEVECWTIPTCASLKHSNK